MELELWQGVYFIIIIIILKNYAFVLWIVVLGFSCLDI